MRVDGSCHCGKIAFAGEVDPNSLTVCHCTDCQQMSGTAFRANISCPADEFQLLRGEPKSYVKVADSGARRAIAFCGDCGVQLYAHAADGPSAYSLRSGTLKQRASFRPHMQIWLRSALPWTQDVLDACSFETGPPKT